MEKNYKHCNEEKCCNIEEHEHIHTHEDDKFEKNLNIIGIIIFVLAIIFEKALLVSNNIYILLYIASYILIGYEIVLNAVKKLFKKDMFDENFLMTVATIGAFCIGEYTEGIAVLLFYKIGEFLQDRAVENSRKKIVNAIDIRSQYANLLVGENTVKIKPEEVKKDDIIIVKTGEKIPLDGIIVSGNTTIDTSALTGELLPKTVCENDIVLSGCINLGAVIKVKVKNTYDKSTIYKIIELIENASTKKSKTEKFISKFAKIYTPIVTLLALLIVIIFPLILDVSFNEALRRSLSFLVVSCPCALVISIPLGFFVGIGVSGKKGILVKGSNYLDNLSKTKRVVLDKTGTLTKGKFAIENIEVIDENVEKVEMLELLVICETFSNHYLAKSVVESYNKNIDISKVSSHKEISGMGITAIINEKKVLVGNDKLLEKYGIKYKKIDTTKTTIHIAINNVYTGYITLSDTLKKGATYLIENLKKVGVNETILLTGDNEEISKEVANKLKIDKVYSNLLPQDKLKVFEKIRGNSKKNEVIIYVGDGINDGPVIAQADVGIAMGNGSDIALDTADIVLMNDEIEKIIDAIKISKATKKIVMQNIILILIIKILFLILSGLGISSMWHAVFADVGISLIAILNSLKITGYK